LGDERDPSNHEDCPYGGADDPRKAKEDGQGYAGQDAVGHSIADKGESAQDDERPGYRAGNRDQDACDEGLEHEPVG